MSTHPAVDAVDDHRHALVRACFEAMQVCYLSAEANLLEAEAPTLRRCLQRQLTAAELCRVTGQRLTAHDLNARALGEVERLQITVRQCADVSEPLRATHDSCRRAARACRQVEHACQELLDVLAVA